MFSIYIVTGIVMAFILLSIVIIAIVFAPQKRIQQQHEQKEKSSTQE